MKKSAEDVNRLFFLKKTYRWPIYTWKDAQHHKSTGKCRAKPQWDITSHLSESLLPKRPQINVSEDAFHSGCTNLHSLKQCTGLPLLPNTCSFMIAVLMGVRLANSNIFGGGLILLTVIWQDFEEVSFCLKYDVNITWKGSIFSDTRKLYCQH